MRVLQTEPSARSPRSTRSTGQHLTGPAIVLVSVQIRRHARTIVCFLSGVGVGLPNFHLVFLPAACFLSGEGFSVVAVVAWVAAIECRVINLLPYPSLPRHNWRLAVGALVHAANGHVVLLKTSTHNETRISLCSVGVECKECVLSSSYVCRYGQCERGRLT